MPTRNQFLTIGSALAVEFETAIRNPDGSEIRVGKRQKNLLLDSGLDKLGGGTAATRITECIRYAAVGTGTNPTLRDSAATTVTIVGGVATASAGFFEAADVGRLLKQDSGSERYITAYTSPTQVTVGGADSAASPFTIWYVNDTGLQTESKRTNTYTNGATDNQSTFTGPDTWTHKQTFLFSAEVAPITYKEIGWSNLSAPGGNLFGRALFNAQPALAAGQQLKVTIFLSVKISPSVQTAVVDVGNNGYNTSGTAMVEWCYAGGQNDGMSGIINPAGGATYGAGGVAMEPGGLKSLSIIRANWAQNAAMTSGVSGAAIGTNSSANSIVAAAYVAKTFIQEYTATFNLSTGNGADHYGITLGSSYKNFTIKFAAVQTKDASHTLAFTWRYSWGRVLVNV